MRTFLQNLNPTIKCIALAFLATIEMANVYVFSKAAMLEVNFYQFQFYWFSFALFWIMVYLMPTKVIKKLPQLSKIKNRKRRVITDPSLTN